ncbi:MAG: hypothetical protein PHC70_05215 [Patescibacteria group bacterium]|nr:hypothetical protein [Patescibacteria group bacterium]
MLEKRRLFPKFLNLAPKAILASLALALGLGFFASPVHAQLKQATNNVNETAQAAGLSQNSADLITIIGRVIYLALSLVGVVFLALLLYSGYQYMTAGGDPEKIKAAISRIRNAVIGLVIIAASFAIVNFILGWITGDQSIFGGTSGTGGGGGLAQWGDTGSLGNGQIIEYHYPEPGQTGVPRNTAIVITFVPPIDPASFINGWTQGQPMSGKLNDLMVGVHPETSKTQNLKPDQALVAVSPDMRTVMIKPNDPLGNAQKPTWYEVKLDSGIMTASSTKLFGGNFSNGYVWRFQVSTQIDNTPPQVLSVIPITGGVYARNVVVQINFNEPMFPSSVAGIFKDGGFQNLQILQVNPLFPPPEQPINGEFRLSNGYRTVEFVTDDECGLNSCLIKMHCLPAEKTIAGRIKAASLASNDSALAAGYKTGVFNGAVDMAFNSMDGDADGKATGPAGDPAGGMDDWPAATTKNPLSFKTNAEINRDPPFIKSVDPAVKADKIALDKNIDVAWHSDPNDMNGVLLAYTISSNSFRIYTSGPGEKDPNSWWFYTKMKNIDDNGDEATSTTKHVQSLATIYHRPFVSSDIPKQGQQLSEVNNYYDPYVRHYVMNVYQNCYNPAAMIDKNNAKLAAPPTKPNFCNDVASLGTDLGGGHFYCDFIKTP